VAERIAALRSSSTSERLEAAEALGRLGAKAEAAARALAAALRNDAFATVRARAAWALGEIGADAREVVPALGVALGDCTPYVRKAAADALGRCGAKAADAARALAQCLRRDAEPSVREAVAAALGRIAPASDAAVEALQSRAKDPCAAVRERAAEALAAIAVRLAPKPPAPSAETASRPAAPPAPRREPALAERVDALLKGEGGMTLPSARVDGERVELTLRLESARFVEENAHVDAARLCLRLFEALPELDAIRVRVLAHNGRELSAQTALGARARPMLAKLGDPFECRRIAQWWTSMCVAL